MFVEIIFVVLMLFWLLGGGYVAYEPAGSFNARAFGTGTLIPWVCVAILGYVVFAGLPAPAPLR